MWRALAGFLVFFTAFNLKAAPSRIIIVVLPFENNSDRTDIAWLSESFADTLSERLSGDGRVVLGREERDEACLQAGIPPAMSMSLASALKVAQSLGADWLVTGSFSLEGDVLTSRAYLVDVDRLRLSEPLEVNGPLNDLAEIETRLAWRILAMQDPNFTVGTEEDFERQFPLLRLDAHENYIRGLLSPDPETRLRYLGEACRRDPTDQRAIFELGRSYYEQKDYENSAQWLGKLSPTAADTFEVRFMNGVNSFFLGHDAAASKIFLELSRDFPLAEVWNNLGFMQARQGHWKEATVSFDRAYQANTADPDFGFNLGVCMWHEGKYKVAVRYFRDAEQYAPDDAEIHRLLSEASSKTGNLEDKGREDEWLRSQEDQSGKGASGILPSPRLKKQFDRRAYRAYVLAGSTPDHMTQGRSRGALSAGVTP